MSRLGFWSLRRKQVFWGAAGSLLIGFVLLGFTSPGTSDMRIWAYWIDLSEGLGLIESYRSVPADYPPLSRVILAWFGGSGSSSDVKLLLLAFWSASVLYALQLSRSVGFTFIFGSLLGFHSIYLGYLDVLWVPFLMGSLHALSKGSPLTSGLLFGIASAIKFQPLIIAPVISAWLLLGGGISIPALKSGVTKSFRWSIGVGVVYGLITSVVGANSILTAREHAFNHPFLSGNALNLPWLGGSIHQLRSATGGEVSYQNITDSRSRLVLLTTSLFYVVVVLLLLLMIKRRIDFAGMLLTSVSVCCAYFAFNVGVHENHLLLPIIVSTPLVLSSRHAIKVAFLLMAMQAINLYLFYGISGTGLHPTPQLWGIDLSVWLSGAFVGLFLWILWRNDSESRTRHLPIFTKSLSSSG